MKRILIVDDEFGIVEALSDVLGDEGYLVVTARNGKEALERIAQTPPDLVIVDYMMPVMDGLELIAKLKASPHRKLPLVLMTAVRRSQVPKGLAIDALLEKPFGAAALLELVKRLA